MNADSVAIDLPESDAALDAVLDSIPDEPAVFLLLPEAGEPLLSRTNVLRRRLRRLLGHAGGGRSALQLRGVAKRIEYWPSASRLESSLTFYLLARKHFPERYRKVAKVPPPAFLRVVLQNPFPRTMISTGTSARSFSFGPFKTRAAAEQFEQQVLELFQVRRCVEDLIPSLDHPGCIYGEMAQCMRPCQQVVSEEEYGSEAHRLVSFLVSRGRSLATIVERMRDHASAEMEFEEAARQHRRLERIHEIWRSCDELAAPSGEHFGVAVTPSREPGAVTLAFLLEGGWLPPVAFPVADEGAAPVSLDRRVRELYDSLQAPALTSAERQDHLALLARWFHSSWRDGEWLGFGDRSLLPYRKVINSIHRVAERSRI